jgi:hypothetical protein
MGIGGGLEHQQVLVREVPDEGPDALRIAQVVPAQQGRIGPGEVVHGEDVHPLVPGQHRPSRDGGQRIVAGTPAPRRVVYGEPDGVVPVTANGPVAGGALGQCDETL